MILTVDMKIVEATAFPFNGPRGNPWGAEFHFKAENGKTYVRIVSFREADRIRKELEVEIATVSANIAGSAPATNARLIAKGTSSTVAPTFDMTSENPEANTATSVCRTHGGTSPIRASKCLTT